MMIGTIYQLLNDPNTQWVLAACVLLGISSGVLGCFALLKKYSLMGDAVAHAALPGICIAYMLYGAKSMSIFMLGASLAGLMGAFCISLISSHTRIKPDTALGIVLSGFFGFGIVLMTKISQTGNASQSGLDAFLFGKAASLVGTDVQVMLIISVVLLAVTFVLFKELKLLCFDPQFGRGIGLPMGFLGILLMLMIVLTVVIGLQAVGVVLMAALLITPAIAARYWTERLSHMVILSGFIGAVSGVLGTVMSALTPKLPTGPVIVLAATAVFLCSMIFAPKRGLLAKLIRLLKVRSRIGMENILQSLYDLSERDMLQGNPFNQGYSLKQLQSLRSQPTWMIKLYLFRLVRKGWVAPVDQTGDMRWTLTDLGLQQAYGVTLNQRLYEMLLIYPMRFGGMAPDMETERVQDIIPEETLHELMALLKEHGRKPSLIPQIEYRASNRYKEYYASTSSKRGDA